MSEERRIIIGYTMPVDMRSMLEKYGMPKKCVKFHLSCDAPDAPVMISFTLYTEELNEGGTELLTETRTFQLVEMTEEPEELAI